MRKRDSRCPPPAPAKGNSASRPGPRSEPRNTERSVRTRVPIDRSRLRDRLRTLRFRARAHRISGCAERSDDSAHRTRLSRCGGSPVHVFPGGNNIRQAADGASTSSSPGCACPSRLRERGGRRPSETRTPPGPPFPDSENLKQERGINRPTVKDCGPILLPSSGIMPLCE